MPQNLLLFIQNPHYCSGKIWPAFKVPRLFVQFFSCPHAAMTIRSRENRSRPPTYPLTRPSKTDQPRKNFNYETIYDYWLQLRAPPTERRDVGRGRLVRKITSSIKGGDKVAEAIRVAFVFMYTWAHFNIKLGCIVLETYELKISHSGC